MNSLNEKTTFSRILLLFSIGLVFGCSSQHFKSKWTKERAPENFQVVFKTTKGEIELNIERRLSPRAVDRFFQLTKHNYFDGNYFYRTIPGFVAQFGASDTLIYDAWIEIKVPDEPVIQGNSKGTISFGRTGPNSRGTDLYINLEDNYRLDTINYNAVVGFPTFGKVIKGMDVVEKLYSGYGSQSMDSVHLMYENPIKFAEYYPELDKIKKAYLKQK